MPTGDILSLGKRAKRENDNRWQQKTGLSRRISRSFAADGRSLYSLSWWAMTGSNCRHPACKAGALPAELIARVRFQKTQDACKKFQRLKAAETVIIGDP